MAFSLRPPNLGNFMTGPNWAELGVPSALIPSPPPFLPLPKGLLMKVEGLGSWKVQVLRPGNTLEEVGTVFAASRLEAEEAAEELVGGGPSVLAIQVARG